jgi:hypothetical protein
VDERADERSSLKKTRAQARTAFQQDAPLGLQESDWLSQASPLRGWQHSPARAQP